MTTGRVQEAIQGALRELQNERQQIDGAITELQGLLSGLPRRAGGRGRVGVSRGRKAAGRRGRRRATTMGRKVARRSPRKAWTAKKRREAAQRMKKYWAERRKQQEGAGA